MCGRVGRKEGGKERKMLRGLAGRGKKDNVEGLNEMSPASPLFWSAVHFAATITVYFLYPCMYVMEQFAPPLISV